MAAMVAVAMMTTNVMAEEESSERGKGPGRGPRMMSAEDRVEMINKDVTLTDEQKTALTTYYTEQMEARKANRPEEGERPDREAMREQMEAERTAEQAKLKEVLTEEQYTAYEKAMADRPRPGDQKGERPEPPAEE